jgi:hypothetical protein
VRAHAWQNVGEFLDLDATHLTERRLMLSNRPTMCGMMTLAAPEL